MPMRYERHTSDDFCLIPFGTTTKKEGSIMNHDAIEKLIKSGEEGRLIDYKICDYDLSDEEKKIDFIKDVLSMANTPRDPNEQALIFLGVKYKIGEDNELVGLDKFRDEIYYQNILKGKLLNVPPAIKCHPFDLGGKKILGIEICIDQNNSSPYVCLQNKTEKLLKDRIYYRVGSSNTEAIGIARENIHRWFTEGTLPPAAEMEDAAWDDLKSRLLYMGQRHEVTLILPASSSGIATQIAHLGVLRPYAVIDLDSESENYGSYKHMERIIKPRRLVHKVQPGDPIHFNPRATTWYFVRGFNDSGLKTEFTYKEWVKANENTTPVLHEIHASTAPKLLTVILLTTGEKVERYEETIIETFAVFNNAHVYVIAEKSAKKNDAFFDEFQDEVSFLPVGIGNFAEAIRHIFVSGNTVREKSLPGSQCLPHLLNDENLAWLNEYLDMCFLEHEFTGMAGPEKFRKGGEPSWEDMYKRYDCDREITHTLTREIEKSLIKRRQDRFNLYHSPGAGGSTVAKRVLWDLHKCYPTGELLLCTPASNVAACLDFITRETSRSLLLLIDSSRFNHDDIEKVYEKLKTEQLPVVMLQTDRKHTPPSNLRSPRSKWLPQDLLRSEAEQMEEAYINCVPAKIANIKAVAKDKRQWQCISFGLAAYAEDYHGIGPYVASRLKFLSPAQKDIMAFFALAHYYGQQSLSPQLFASFLHKTASNLIELEDIFTGEATGAFDLLVLEDDATEYRIMHHLIAKEILRQILSVGEQEVRENLDENINEDWKAKLSTFARDFAIILAKNGNSLRIKDILYRVFIDRAPSAAFSHDKLPYSMLFEDIPSEHGRLELFRSLGELFPHEAHIHAHMARMNSHVGDFETAKLSIRKALNLTPKDDVIIHIHGTILHREIIKALRKKKIDWTHVEAQANEALDCYEQSRSLDDSKEHGYTSAVELCIQIVSSAKKIFSKSLAELLLDRSRGQFFLSLLGTANELLDAAFDLRIGSTRGAHIELCGANLRAVYDDYSKALECYNNILSWPDVSKPPLRRLLARTYELRSGQATKEFEPDTATRIYNLMETNIREEKNYTKNMPLWLKAARKLENPPSLNRAIEQITYWKAESKDINASFYIATLLSLQAIEGITGALRQAEIALEECKHAARYNAKRTHSREWLIDAPGIKSFIPHTLLGKWDENIDFFTHYSNLKIMEGRISKISNNGKGTVTLKCGLNAFFIPSRFGVTQGKDENESIKFYLAFSYDGLIAWRLPSEELPHS